jgi:hypothetical protein
MHKAYDTILQSEVPAFLAAENGEFEPYRYECSCCGEEVYLAAPYSTRMVAHFRHRSGNNDVECENYLGQYGAISTDSRPRTNNRERVEFYFDNRTKTFSLGLRFSADEIQGYEQQNVDFEIRIEDSVRPFYALSINNIHFASDVPTLIILNNFSLHYYLSNTLSGIKRKYDFLKPGNIPTFFKLQGNDSDFKGKLVRGTAVFTNVQYLVIFHDQHSIPQSIRLPDEVLVNDKFSFETMGSKFLGMTLSIQTKTACIDKLLDSWGYLLETSETLTLLWPPAPVINDVNIITSDDAFLFASFELQAHGNINVHSKDISEVNEKVYRVSVKPKTTIFKKNAEIVLEKLEQPLDSYSVLTTSASTVSKFTVSNDGPYFLFNSFGVTLLKDGQVVFMTPQSVIVRYECNYPTGYIYPCGQKEWVGDKLLEDILMHCKRTEAFDSNLFMLLSLSDTASRYIDKCKSSGLINSVVKQSILEGSL